MNGLSGYHKYAACAALFTFTFLLLINVAYAEQNDALMKDPEQWLPFSLAPIGQFGGSITGEYDTRSIGGSDLSVRRFLLRLGWSPSPNISLWAGGGVGNLLLEDASISLQGDYGTAVGAGVTLSTFDLEILGLKPFVSCKGMFLISRMSDDRAPTPTKISSVRRRYQWYEGYGVIGGGLELQSSKLIGGATMRLLNQEEQRHTRNSLNQDVSENIFEYNSGIKPGVILAIQIPLDRRFSLWIAGEGYVDGFNVTLSAGQWGAP